MNKLIIILSLLLISITNSSFGMNDDKVEQAALKFIEQKDYHEHTINLNNKNTRITSFFDFSKNIGVMERTFTPDMHGNYDLRPLETTLCRFAQASQPFYKQHRGKMGFFAGAIFMFLWYKRTYDATNKNNSSKRIRSFFIRGF